MISQQDLFQMGESGYHTFRIPSVLVTKSGAVLAFAEGRKNGPGDAGEIHIVMRKSLDHGETWGPLSVIAADGTNTIGNPCPVQDRETGAITVILCRNPEDGHERDILAGKSHRDVLMIRSEDDGETWTALIDITKDVKLPGWTWYASGPCHGIQMQTGRLVIPCNHAELVVNEERSGPYISHVIYSDDGGKTWQLGGSIGENTNECTLCELNDGSLYMNMRSYHGQNRRAFAWSEDGGLTWSEPQLDDALIEPVCQGSVIQAADDIVLFSNPASDKRENLTVKISRDHCKTWEIEQVLYEGPSAYSDLALTNDGAVLCFYECGAERPYDKIRLAKFRISS